MTRAGHELFAASRVCGIVGGSHVALEKPLFRTVLALAFTLVACRSPDAGVGQAPAVTAVLPNALVVGVTTRLTLVGAGTHFGSDTTLALGDGVTVESVAVRSPIWLSATVRVAAAAVPGPREVVVTTGDESVAQAGMVTVEAPNRTVASGPARGGSVARLAVVPVSGPAFAPDATVSVAQGQATVLHESDELIEVVARFFPSAAGAQPVTVTSNGVTASAGSVEVQPATETGPGALAGRFAGVGSEDAYAFTPGPGRVLALSLAGLGDGLAGRCAGDTLALTLWAGGALQDQIAAASPFSARPLWLVPVATGAKAYANVADLTGAGEDRRYAFAAAFEDAPLWLDDGSAPALALSAPLAQVSGVFGASPRRYSLPTVAGTAPVLTLLRGAGVDAASPLSVTATFAGCGVTTTATLAVPAGQLGVDVPATAAQACTGAPLTVTLKPGDGSSGATFRAVLGSHALPPALDGC